MPSPFSHPPLPHTHTLAVFTHSPETTWAAGQSCFHPDTVVVCGLGPLSPMLANEWGLMMTTLDGCRYYYGWCRIVLVPGEQPVIGWLLLPRG